MLIKKSSLKDLHVLGAALKNNDWVYSRDGKTIQAARGFWDKLKLAIYYCYSPSIFGASLDFAVINMFSENMQPLISVIKVYDDKDRVRRRWFPISTEWHIHPQGVIDRCCSEQVKQTRNPLNLENYSDLNTSTMKKLVQMNKIFDAAILAQRYLDSRNE